MSWKATAFVKELRDNLIVTEKFVLLMLAEYHRTDDKLSWPSISTLAYDCLMEERSVRRILARLEEASFIRRKVGGGRGNVTAYQIAGLDYQNPVSRSGLVATINPDTESVIPETVFLQTLITDTLNPDTNPDRGSQRNKEALGGTGERGVPLPFSDLKPCEAARMYLEHEDICVPAVKFSISDVEAGIQAIQRERKIGTMEALEWLLAQARKAKAGGKKVGPEWVRKTGYNDLVPKKPIPMVNAYDLKMAEARAAQTEGGN